MALLAVNVRAINLLVFNVLIYNRCQLLLHFFYVGNGYLNINTYLLCIATVGNVARRLLNQMPNKLFVFEVYVNGKRDILLKATPTLNGVLILLVINANQFHCPMG